MSMVAIGMVTHSNKRKWPRTEPWVTQTFKTGEGQRLRGAARRAAENQQRRCRKSQGKCFLKEVWSAVSNAIKSSKTRAEKRPVNVTTRK